MKDPNRPSALGSYLDRRRAPSHTAPFYDDENDEAPLLLRGAAAVTRLPRIARHDGFQNSYVEARPMTFDRIRHRLDQGRPLVLDADTGASFRARGVELDAPGTLGLLLRERPGDVLAHHRAEVQSAVDVLSTLTADTTPRALAAVGMQDRAALVTGQAGERA